VLEDHSRLHYEPHELRVFEKIGACWAIEPGRTRLRPSDWQCTLVLGCDVLAESEWPLFFTYLALDALFRSDLAAADRYFEKLSNVMVPRDVRGLGSAK